MEFLLSSLLGLSLGSDPKPPVRLSPVISTVRAVQTLSVVSTGSKERGVDRRSKGLIPSISSLLGESEEYTCDSIIDVVSPLTAQQKFQGEDLYPSN
ncbi:hypothetical protein AYI68_g3718 [Smittium mucronatum]|uniref:Uncharacterized protein n=1 Tax=Smittium mucronatum TaxID=133383 RepID=A0A1R0GZ65_9FUNG|nr:hypothetical protein AYI68_g3718 [Smittium mucronatum]